MRPRAVLITAPRLADAAVDLLGRHELIPIFTPAGVDRQMLPKLAAEAQRERGDVVAAISRTLPFDRAVFDALPSLRIVCKHGAGVDNIDIAAAKAAGVAVARTSGVNARSVAEHALALSFAVARHLVPLAASTRSGSWDRGRWQGEELSGKTLGLIGFGQIGRELAAMARPLFADVLAHDPFARPEDIAAVGARPVDLVTLRKESGIVSLHCPLSDGTRGLVDARFIDDMRPGAILINTARGEIVDEAALLAALDSGQLAGAGLDALVEEGPGPSPLKQHERVVVTPHVGASTRQALEKVAERAAEIVIDTLAGRPLRPGELLW